MAVPKLTAAGKKVAMAAIVASTSLIFALCHLPAEGNIFGGQFGGVEEYSVIGKMVATYLSGIRGEIHAPVPEEVANKQVIGSGKKPTPWPKVFHMKVQLRVNGESPLLHVYYDFPRHRMMNIVVPVLPHRVVSLLEKDVKERPEAYSETMKRTIKAFEQSEESNGVVDQLDKRLFFPDTAIWMLFVPGLVATFSRKTPFCVTREVPSIVVPPPDILTDATFMGQETTEGVQCNVYSKGRGPVPFNNKALVVYYEDANTGAPVKFVFFNGAEMVVKEFVPKGTLDDSDWEVPSYCDVNGTEMVDLPRPILQ